MFLEGSCNNILMNKKIISVHDIFVSILFVICVNRYLLPHELFGRYTIFNLVLLYFVFKMLFLNSKCKLSDKKYPLMFSFMFSLCLLIGKGIYNTNNLFLMFNSYKKIIAFILGLYSFTIVFSEIVFDLFKLFQKFDINKKSLKLFNNKHIFFIIWFLIFASWIPVFFGLLSGYFVL